MNIITGYRGEPHITSAQDRAGNQGSYGEASYVLNVGSKFSASVISANEIRISDGILSHQGCLTIIETGTYDSVSINNGAQGMNRIDRIVARYTKDSETNVESVELAVIQGTATSSTPTAPDYNHGTIADGDSPVDMPLYQVRLTGITVTSCTAEFATVRTQKEMDTLLGNTSISGIGGGTVTGAISALNSKVASTTGTFSSVESVTLSSSATLHKVNDIVYFNIDATTSSQIGSGSSGSGFITFPTGFRPQTAKDFVGRVTSGTLGEFYLNSNGQLQTLTTIPSGSTFRLSGSFSIN